jgi:quinol monooxygenase YgiN
MGTGDSRATCWFLEENTACGDHTHPVNPLYGRLFLLEYRQVRPHSERQLGAGYVAPVDDAEITLVTMRFQATDAEKLLGVLSKYVVLSRQQPGSRNIDLTASVTNPGRFVVIQKWDSPESQQAHFNSAEMVEMAQACVGILSEPPEIDLLEGLSAHDLN